VVLVLFWLGATFSSFSWLNNKNACADKLCDKQTLWFYNFSPITENQQLPAAATLVYYKARAIKETKNKML
jgi:hypothetical protein